MKIILSLIIATANILGSFNDPFEFAGDYGPSMNPTREKVFELLISQETRWKNATVDEVLKQMGVEVTTPENLQAFRKALIDQGIAQDVNHGPTYAELVTPALLEALRAKQSSLNSPLFTPEDLKAFEEIVQQEAQEKPFAAFRKSEVVYDKLLRDKASREGKPFDLQIVSSSAVLTSKDPETLKINLLNQLFTEDNLSLGSAKELLSYWLYQSLNLHLIGQDPELIAAINRVKQEFAKNLGNPKARAAQFKDKLLDHDIGVLFTQESDQITQQALLEGGTYLRPEGQNAKDGTLVFLRQDRWKDPESLDLPSYPGSVKGRVNLVLAVEIDSGIPFLLAAAHGNSTNPEDGRNQISHIMEKYNELKTERGLENLQLLIGIDANTKSEQDVEDLKEHLDKLGLVGTSSGPTTVKRRMVTVQHSKTYRLAIDEEDFLITLKPESGALFTFSTPHVGFGETAPDISEPLPNVNNLSDHYPVWTQLKQ